MRTKKRTLLTTKVYGFNPWMDQVTAINQMMESSGQKSEAPILRDLIDEALAARRRKDSVKEAPEQSAVNQEAEMLQTIQTLLLRIIGQEQSAFRIQSLGLEVLQETLAETRAGRMAAWSNLIAPSQAEKGKGAAQIAKSFDDQTTEAKEFAYSLAGEIKDQLDAADADSEGPSEDGDDRQGRLTYDDPNQNQLRVS
ncbi:MAG: hypothetical protein M3Y84_08515 [Acidobacteriota bacterium]|nr:hypothetical protein [Acidobacteriota bacterium]